jgi:hypothetical protein
MPTPKPLPAAKSMKQKMPSSKNALSPETEFQDFYLLKLIAYGHRYLANQMISQTPDLLLQRSDVTDYSGRTFKNITAYEYAYWAKDTHACRILETHMNAAIKADILKCCQAIEKDGLSYEQYGQVIKHSKHFDFGPFIKALEQYVAGYGRWLTTSDWKAIESAWMMVGQAQRDVPVHVAHEYCRIDRAFHPTPTFDEAYLPENLTIFNYKTEQEEVWFPLGSSDASGLGINFGIVFAGRGSRKCYVVRGPDEGNKCWDYIARWLAWRDTAVGDADLAAIQHLDVVRTADLKQSLKNLKLV